MAETTNEMNLPIISAPAMGVTGDIAASMYAPDANSVPPVPPVPDETMVIGSPDNGRDPSQITVYSQSITPVSYNENAGSVAAFDIVFSVGINCGEGVTKTYQVVKRIGIDKVKLACDAECSTPVSIVETKSDALKEEAAAQRRRFRRLAGLE